MNNQENKDSKVSSIVNRVNSFRVLALASLASIAVVAMAQTPPDLNIDYTDHVEGFGVALKSVITTNMAVLFLILAMVVGFGFIWNHVRRLGRSL